MQLVPFSFLFTPAPQTAMSLFACVLFAGFFAKFLTIQSVVSVVALQTTRIPVRDGQKEKVLSGAHEARTD